MGLLPPAFRVRAKGMKLGQLAEGVVAGEALVSDGRPKTERSLAVPWDEFVSRRHFQLGVEGKAVRVTRLPSGKNPLTFREQPTDTLPDVGGRQFVIGNTTFELLEDPFQTGRRTATCTAVDYVQLVRSRPTSSRRCSRTFRTCRGADHRSRAMPAARWTRRF